MEQKYQLTVWIACLDIVQLHAVGDHFAVAPAILDGRVILDRFEIHQLHKDPPLFDYA